MVYRIWVIGCDELPGSVADLLRECYSEATVELIPAGSFRDWPGTADLAVVTNYDVSPTMDACRLMCLRPDLSYLLMVDDTTRERARQLPSHLHRQTVDKPTRREELGKAVAHALCI